MLSRQRKDVKPSWGRAALSVFDLAGKLKNTCKTKKNKFKYRHVKAHTSIKDSRTWVNNWCDKEAKKWMKVEREKIKQQIITT